MSAYRSSKKILSLPVLISFIGHILVISATGLINMHPEKQEKETIINVNLQQRENEQDREAEREQQAKSRPEPPPSEVKQAEDFAEETVDIESQDERYMAYLRTIKKKIEQIWSYPDQALKGEQEGISTVKFSLDRRGRLVGSRGVSSSGHAPLDREAIKVVRAAAPYEPFPQDINLSRLHILATFRYTFLN